MRLADAPSPRRVLEAMLSLAVNPQASTQARAIARITDFNRDPAKCIPAKPIKAPPAMPIGNADDF
jgi:hypothetical protein